MDPSLVEVWQTASGSPFRPAVGKGTQFSLGFSLVVIGLGLTGRFLLHRSFASLPLVGLPASAALAIGVVYMFCAVGVYV